MEPSNAEPDGAEPSSSAGPKPPSEPPETPPTTDTGQQIAPTSTGADNETDDLVPVIPDSGDSAGISPGDAPLVHTSIKESTDLLSMYLTRYERPETQRAYKNDIVQFFGTDEVVLPLARKATFMHVNRHIRNLEEDDRAASTIQRRVSAIRGFFDWLVALELIPRNPADAALIRKTRRANASDRSITFLSRAQSKRLLRATQEAGEASHRDHALLLVLLHCVLRRSEAAAMDVEHIRPLGHYWVLDLPDTKGGTDQYVKIPAHVVDVIDDMKSHYGIEEGPLWRSFSNRNRGDRITGDAIYRIVRRTAERADLPDIGAHALRHTGCTLALESGATIEQVKTHARHKDIDTTMAYIHQRDKLRDSAADRINL
ncbi:integrase [Longimonas halophila]|uniref:Integrase n=1 Tax=Longimonas halophila TaxID=1469170 RepID=A0A2H3PB96_9BACT|nr:tyrosine-type recombinase/integrase [Longimonas halophila]PEN09538.1 integrase [Longimonas halophila]